MSEKKFSIKQDADGFSAYKIPSQTEAKTIYDMKIPDWASRNIYSIEIGNTIKVYTKTSSEHLSTGDYICKVCGMFIGVKKQTFEAFFTEV